ncbi:MAG: DcaP family trimeric outer membrane transporter [Acidobacteriota bacterium]
MSTRILAGAFLASLIGSGWARAQEPADIEKITARIEALQRELDELRSQVQQIQRGAAPVAGAPGAPPAAGPAPAPTAVSPAIVQYETLSGDPYAAARIDNAPIDPELKGFFAIPFTETRLRIGGYAKLDAIHDFKPIGDHDFFTTSTIPVEPGIWGDNTNIQARQTRLNIEMRRPTPAGMLRFYYENDFTGSYGPRVYNLRHAYGQLHNFLAGFTFSSMVDIDSTPDTLDFEGPGSTIFVFQPQVRYTHPITKHHSIALSVEKGTSDIVTETDVNQTITPTSPWPDGVFRWRYETDAGHLQVGVVLRSVGGYMGNIAEEHVFARGLSFSGNWLVVGSDNVQFQLNAGDGFGRYFSDISGLAADVGLDSDGKMVPLPAYGFFGGYQHYWRPAFRSTVTYGYLNVDSVDKTLTTDFHASHYAAANLIWHPKGSAFNMGIEGLYGKQTLKTGESGDATRLQFAFQYDFVK